MTSGDRWALCVLASVGIAALLKVPVPAALVLAALLLAVTMRNRWLVGLALVVLVSALSAHAWAGLDAPVPADIDGVGTVIQDPTQVSHATRAEVRVYGRHYVVWAYGHAAYQLRTVEAGDRVHVVGNTRALSGVSAPSLRRRHIAASINLQTLEFVDHGNSLARMANGVRNLIAGGSRSMPITERALLSGFVYGDDRSDTPAMTDNFRDAGLSHLLAVSGENVAFVLLLTLPLLKRFSVRGRFVGGLVVLLLFGVVTRWEPSVVRAEMMAGVALTGVMLGRPISTWRCIGLGSTLALLFDPFLIGSVGFLLSVSACLGMAGLGRTFSNYLRGPAWLSRAVAYSAAAQIGVIPVQFAVFNSVPTVGLLTNVVAEPLAGLVMIWGVIGGLAAGIVPVVALQTVIHWPDTAMLWFINEVASAGAAAERSTLGKFVGGGASVLMMVVLVTSKRATTVDERDGSSSAVGLSDQGRRPVAT